MLIAIIRNRLALITSLVIAMSISHAYAQQRVEHRDYERYDPLPSLDLRYIGQQSNRELSYVYYQQYHNNVKIQKSKCILVVDNETQKILKTYNHTVTCEPTSEFPVSYSIDHPILDSIASISLLTEYEPRWYPTAEGLSPSIYCYYELESQSISGILDLSTQTLRYLDANNSYFGDSLMHARLFSPDPLTADHSYYGFPIVDSADLSYPAIMNTVDWIDFHCDFDVDSSRFVPENKYVKIQDFEAPNNNVAYSVVDSFSPTRTDFRFEDFMVIAHIDRLQQWIGDLGVTGLQNFQLNADPHAHFGQDNSTFRAYAGTKTDELAFGIGNVDDAEDADVITHEYTHGLLHAPHGILVSNFSHETKGLQEGIADFVAAAYSYKIDPWGWNRVFSWDGHNPYWNGRVANTSRLYSSTITNIYDMGEVINAALFDVVRNRDLDSTMKLVLESLFLVTETTTLPQYANIILDLDTMLYGGALSSDLCPSFGAYKILPRCDTTIAVEDIETEARFQILQGRSFLEGKAELRILFDQNKKHLEYAIYNTQGQLIRKEYSDNTNQLMVSPDRLSGYYFLYLTDNHDIWSFPIYVHQ